VKETCTPNLEQKPLAADAGAASIARLEKFRNADGSKKTAEIRLDLQKAMQTHCSVYRTSESMSEGLEKITAIAEQIKDVSVSDKTMVWNTDLMETLELDNLIAQARVTMANWMKHTLSWYDGDTNTVKIDYRPVHDYTMTDGIEYIKPKKRVY